YDGGNGSDTLDYSQATQCIDINLVEGKAVSVEIGEDSFSSIEAVIGGSGDDHFTIGADAVTLTGGAGNDCFSFDVPYDEDDRDLIHQILDLEAGDRIIVSQYQIRTDDDPANGAPGGEADPFASAYGDEAGTASQPFRFRIEKIGDNDYTYVDVFLEQTDEKDYSIEIQGSHRLYYY
ncbi:M10 family metallopeptidase C-terminal domain-containing protein, partial [Bosea sp. 2RAB26]|uniref:M10 family metallopeptidase C-terminal domain-containing protein n=1 Tax=Bosea sp. 2RAB26 TaxID=3237476 RepID=UPI003F914EA5